MKLITCALPYANGPLHIGHISGVYLPADIYTRFLKLKKEDIALICGSDEHGAAITIKARQEDKEPQEIVDYYHSVIKESFEKFGIQFDIYSRTSSDLHHRLSSEFFTALHQKGIFEVNENEQYYDEKEQMFLADRYIVGTCPNCSFEYAYGDQCENCGSTLSPKELINPKSTLSGEEPILKKTKHWFLPLDKYEPWLREWILDQHKDDWKSNVYGQCKSWLDDGLKPRAVTRDLDWGVQVPLEEAKDKVLYVWFDAPIGYITATQEWAERHGKSWMDIWGDEDTELIHFVGKDNIVFHCIIFPCMLRAHENLIVPTNVPANEFMNLEGKKISTSKNWAVWLHEYLRDFENQQDILRYVLCANTPETKDSDFTWSDFKTRNNSELVAIFGNFVNRTLVLTHKYFGGKVPKCNTIFDLDNELIANMNTIKVNIDRSILKYRFREALAQMIEVARIGNKYLAETEPWKETDQERVETIMYLSIQLVANLTIFSEPFLPFTADKLRKILNLEPLHWDSCGSIDLISSGSMISKAEKLFAPLEDKDIPMMSDSTQKIDE